jgi:hypothetical protein
MHRLTPFSTDRGANPKTPGSPKTSGGKTHPSPSPCRRARRLKSRAATMAPTGANLTPASPSQVHPSRVRVLNPGGGRETTGPVVYWMLRDQRLADNWALLHAVGLAAAAVPAAPVAIIFSLFPRPFLLGARRRQLGFLPRGLRHLAADARARGLPFFFLESGPTAVPALVRRLSASALVADFSPLRPVREALDAVVGELRRDAPGLAVQQVSNLALVCRETWNLWGFVGSFDDVLKLLDAVTLIYRWTLTTWCLCGRRQESWSIQPGP